MAHDMDSGDASPPNPEPAKANLTTRVQRFLGNPWVSLAGFVLTIVFGVLSVVFYFQTLQSKEITYFVSSPSAKVIDANRLVDPAAVRVIDSSGAVVPGDVYLT